MSKENPDLLHLFTSEKHASPFDVNMAYDAGFDAVTTYAGADASDISTLTQDAIFSRGPNGAKRTAIMIGGRDLESAIDSFEAAKAAMFPPFEVSVFVDPSGAFTTAAAMVAKVSRALADTFNTSLKDAQVVVPGGTGPVGLVAGVLAARAGAHVSLISSSSMDKAIKAQQVCKARYGVDVTPLHVSDTEQMQQAVATADVIMAAAKAGVQVVGEADLAAARQLKVAADVNAVPPAGIVGLDVMLDAKPLEGAAAGTVGIGALAIGNIKYKVEHGLFKQILASDKAIYLDFQEAFALAENLVSG